MSGEEAVGVDVLRGFERGRAGRELGEDGVMRILILDLIPLENQAALELPVWVTDR